MDLWAGLSNEFDCNILYTTRGHLTLAHTDSALRTMRWRAEVNKHLGVDSELIFPDEIARLCPTMNLSRKARWPVLGALSHRSEEHTSELQSLMRISYAVFCLKKKKTITIMMNLNNTHTI